jgi:hypothetical protein
VSELRVTVTIGFTGAHARQLITLAEERAVPAAQVVYEIVADKLPSIRTATRRPDFGPPDLLRPSMLRTKIQPLHERGLTDEQIAAHLDEPLARVRIHRAILGFEANQKDTP